MEQVADIPVPHLGIFEGFQGFHPGQSTAASSEQLVDIPVPHGGPHLQDPGLASLPQEVPGQAGQGFFRTFPRKEKVGRLVRTRGRNCSPESSPSTRAAHSDQFWEDESGGTWMLLPSGRWYLLCSSGMARDDGHGERHRVRLLLRGPVASVVLASAYSLWSTLHTETMAASGRLGQALVMRQFTVAFESISSPLCSRCSHLESGAFSPCPCIWQSLFTQEAAEGVYAQCDQ